MAEGDPSGSRSCANFDESVIYPGNEVRSNVLDISFKNIRTVQDQSEEISQLRRENFNLRLLCYKYDQVFRNGEIENSGLRIYDLEQANARLREQLSHASRLLSSLKNENEELKSDCDEWIRKFESCEEEWRRKCDLLTKEFQELKSSQRRAESRCETIESESSRLENVKNAEIAALQQKLSSAESKIAVLVAELAELSNKSNASIDRFSSHLSSEDKENVSLLEMEALLEPITSPHKISISSLLRRYRFAQETMKSLKSNCDSLTLDLSNCKQQQAVTECKLHLILEQYDKEKASHLKDLAHFEATQAALHVRIANLLNDCNEKAKLNDELAGQLNQMKEFDARIKEEHMRQLNKLHKLLQDRERVLLEMCAPESCPALAADRCPLDETSPITEVTQHHHEIDSSVFDATADVVETGEQRDDKDVELARLQHEVGLLRSKLIAQVKANTRLKVAFNALSESAPIAKATPGVLVPPPTVNMSMSINASILDEANASQVNDSFIGLFGLLNSNRRVSQTLDRTVNELRATLSKVEAELSTSLLEKSQASASRIEDEEVRQSFEGLQNTSIKLDRLRDVYSLIKGLVDQFDNLRAFRNSFHETVNRSIMASSLCLETSAKYAVPESAGVQSTQTSFFGSAPGSGIVAPEAPAKELEPEKSVSEVMSVSQVHNNTTFHLLREPNETRTADNTMEDLSMASVSCRSLFGRRGDALDITGLEVHSRKIFDRVALAVAAIQEALDAWSLKAATGMLTALNVPDVEQFGSPGSPTTFTDLDAVNLPMDTALDLVTRFAEVLSKTKDYVVDSAAFSDWCDSVHQWFELFIETLQKDKGTSGLAENGAQLDALEQRFNNEFALVADSVVRPRDALSHQNAELQVSIAATQTPCVSLSEHESAVTALSSRCEHFTSTIEKLKADLSLNVRSLTVKEAEVADLEAKLQDLEMRLNETHSIARTKEARVEELETAASESKLALANLRERLAESESRLAEKEARVAELKTAVKDMRSIYDDLENQLTKANQEVDEWRAKTERLEDSLAEIIERESSVSLKLSSTLVELEHLQGQNSALATQLKEQAEEYEMKMTTEISRYKALLEVADTKFAEIREQFQRLQTQRDELLAEVETRQEEVVGLESDLAMARLVSAETQLTLGDLMGNASDAVLKPEEEEDLEGVRQKAQKYPKLKAIAFELKDLLAKRSSLLEKSTKETKRLKLIIAENERRAKGFSEELERLRQQIIVKNGVIKNLKTLARNSSVDVGTLRPASSATSEKREETSSPENARAAPPDYLSPELLNPGETTELIDGETFHWASSKNTYALPPCFDGMNSLVANIDATVREISVGLNASADNAVENSDDDTSASLADQLTGYSTDTPTSLSASFAKASTQNVSPNANIPERISHLFIELSNFWSAMSSELKVLLNSVQAIVNSGKCSSADLARARKLIRRSIEALGKVPTRNLSEILISNVVDSLNEALRLLRQIPASGSPDRTTASRLSNFAICSPQQPTTGRSGETVAAARTVVNADPVGTSSSCSCSCRRRCSRMAASVHELTNISVSNTATVLTGRLGCAGVEKSDLEESVEENSITQKSMDPLSK